MLTTHNSDEFIPHQYRLAPEERVWRKVNFELDIPYFLVSYEVRAGKSSFIQTSLFWQLRDLLLFCEKLNENNGETLLQLVLLNPASMNHEKCWGADNLKEIWVVRDPIKKYHSVRYVTTDGNCFFDPPVSDHNARFTDQRILFSSSNCNEHVV